MKDPIKLTGYLGLPFALGFATPKTILRILVTISIITLMSIVAAVTIDGEGVFGLVSNTYPLPSGTGGLVELVGLDGNLVALIGDTSKFHSISVGSLILGWGKVDIVLGRDIYTLESVQALDLPDLSLLGVDALIRNVPPYILKSDYLEYLCMGLVTCSVVLAYRVVALLAFCTTSAFSLLVTIWVVCLMVGQRISDSDVASTILMILPYAVAMFGFAAGIRIGFDRIPQRLGAATFVCAFAVMNSQGNLGEWSSLMFAFAGFVMPLAVVLAAVAWSGLGLGFELEFALFIALFAFSSAFWLHSMKWRNGRAPNHRNDVSKAPLASQEQS